LKQTVNELNALLSESRNLLSQHSRDHKVSLSTNLNALVEAQEDQKQQMGNAITAFLEESTSSIASIRKQLSLQEETVISWFTFSS
jgi:hypothetical protein